MALAFMSTMSPALLAASASSFSVTEIGGQEYVEISGGPFVMGSPAFDDAAPHWVELSDFAIGRTAVSAEQYRLEIQSGDGPINSLQADHPVTHVDWYDAHRYFAQLSRDTERSIGLPTEAQWEFAARGRAVPYVEMMAAMEAEGLPLTLEAFVEVFAPDRLENFVPGAAGRLILGAAILNDLKSAEFRELFESGDFLAWRVHATLSGRLTPEEAYYKREGPGPVDWGPGNAYGLKGMTGGVWEWVDDWYGERTYQGSMRKDPRGPQAGGYKGLRGGCWYDINPDYLRAACRYNDCPGFRYYDIGFRGVVAPQDSR